MDVQQVEGKAREVVPQQTIKTGSTSPGKSPGKPPGKSPGKPPGKPPNISPAKFCKRERGGICPGNCNACLMQYLFGQYH
jgi:hypothetical protein